MNDLLLILDIDGVLALEIGPPYVAKQEIFALHSDLTDELDALKMKIVVLTHRSRPEAFHLLSAVGVPTSQITSIFAAEDIFLFGLKDLRLRSAMKGGLMKSFLVNRLEHQFRTSRRNMIFVDDQPTNIDAMQNSGLGLCLLAPFSVNEDSKLVTTFPFSAVTQQISLWADNRQERHIDRLSERRCKLDSLRPSGMDTSGLKRGMFSGLRMAGRNFRRLLSYNNV